MLKAASVVKITIFYWHMSESEKVKAKIPSAQPPKPEEIVIQTCNASKKIMNKSVTNGQVRTNSKMLQM